MRFVRIHKNIAIMFLFFWFFNANPLVPAMHSANRIGMHGVGNILMHTTVFPKNSYGILSEDSKGSMPEMVFIFHPPFPLLSIFTVFVAHRFPVLSCGLLQRPIWYEQATTQGFILCVTQTFWKFFFFNLLHVGSVNSNSIVAF